jgi:hypothetical protein
MSSTLKSYKSRSRSPSPNKDPCKLPVDHRLSRPIIPAHHKRRSQSRSSIDFTQLAQLEKEQVSRKNMEFVPQCCVVIPQHQILSLNQQKHIQSSIAQFWKNKIVPNLPEFY